MNWEDEVTLSGQPLVLPTRPIRQGGRYRAEDRTVYVQGGNRLLIPAVPHRSASASGHGRHSPTQIFITNQNRDDHSPVRSSRRRSQHDRRFEDDDDDSPPRHGRNRSRARARSRSHSRRRESRTPSPSKSEIEKRVKHEERMKRLVELEKREEEQERRHKYEQERLLEEAQRAEQKKREDELKKRAIEDHEIELAKEAVKAKEKKEREEKEFQERVKTTFAAAGYSEESIEQILQKDGKGKEVQKKIVDLRRPTYIKVNRKYLSPDTLDAYSLPWEWDEVSCP